MAKGVKSKTIFFYNAESMFSFDGAVEGRIAEGMAAISARSLWYGYGTLILPRKPDEEFSDYVKNFAKKCRVIVPASARDDRLSISDTLNDPVMSLLVRNRHVTSYMASPTLFNFVKELNGEYLGGDPTGIVEHINNKAQYGQLSKGIVEVPKGKIVQGIDEAVKVTADILSFSKEIHARKVNAAGGHGNRRFDFTDLTTPSAEEVRRKLMEWSADWSKPVLIEEYVTLVSSPAATFEHGKGLVYDNLQITHEGQYWGLWSPLPTSLFDISKIATIGDRFAKRAGKLGYRLRANTDLGVTDKGELIGFEINGRVTASSHTIAIGELFLGPWNTWRQRNIVVLSIDHFELRSLTSFKDIHDVLHTEGLLATPQNPYGIVITIPPYKTRLGMAMGLQFHARGSGDSAYFEAENLYWRAIHLIGDEQKNTHDSSLTALLK